MYIEATELMKCRVKAIDGRLGTVEDLLFDDHSMKIRYVDVDTGHWLPGKRVVLNPEAICSVDIDSHLISFNLKKHQIESAPALALHLPVSKQFEEELHDHYSWTPYWSGVAPVRSWFPYPGNLWPSEFDTDGDSDGDGQPTGPWQALERYGREQRDAHLRSCQSIRGYRLADRQGEKFGEVANFIIDSDTWTILDIEMDSRKWLPGGKTFTCSPLFVVEFSRKHGVARLDLDRDTLVSSPEFSMKTYGPKYHEEVVEHYFQHEGLKLPEPHSQGSGPMAQRPF